MFSIVEVTTSFSGAIGDHLWGKGLLLYLQWGRSCCDSATDQLEKKASYITHNDWSVASSIWAAMRHQNKPPPRGYWRQKRGLDVEMVRSDWWRGN